jgi:hypothetical protein
VVFSDKDIVAAKLLGARAFTVHYYDSSTVRKLYVSVDGCLLEAIVTWSLVTWQDDMSRLLAILAKHDRARAAMTWLTFCGYRPRTEIREGVLNYGNNIRKGKFKRIADVHAKGSDGRASREHPLRGVRQT